MPTHFGRLLLGAATLCLAACASRPLPRYEKPLSRSATQQVRTTAYTHSESDHLAYGARSAAGSYLQYGRIHSAAADWSRWPNGTLFRIRETGELCQVDDYGWALSGTNTIDLYKPSRAGMNAWGVRRVNIDILSWGDAWKSYGILHPRKKYAHVRRMLKQIDDRYSRTAAAPSPTVNEGVLLASAAPIAPAVPLPVATPEVYRSAPPALVSRPEPPVRRAEPVLVRVATRAPSAPSGAPSPAAARNGTLTPFYP